MSHHGNDDPELNKALHHAMKQIFGEFPHGKLNDNDAGALAYAVFAENGVVVIKFPKLIQWIGLEPEQAIEMAEVLVKHARKCGCKKPLTFNFGGKND